MRLDLYLYENFDIQSRNKAQELIKSKKIKIDGKIVSKSSFVVEEGMEIIILEDEFYVSRAAYKLKYFLDEINLDLKDKNALDIGSSTGGFTQILLQKNVKSVSCVDVGSNQLHERIRDDKRIKIFENCDIRDFIKQDDYDIVTCDVSFISILNIIESINKNANDDIIILFKPQFEVGANIKRDSKGVVKDQEAIRLSRERFLEKTNNLKWILQSSQKSKLDGKEGNSEELFYFKKSINIC